MTKIQKLLVGFLATVLLTIFSCAAFQDAITPCFIDPACIQFADANVPTWLPWTTIADAGYVNDKMDYIRDMSELEYSYLKDGMVLHLADARELQRTLFSPEGPIGLLLPALGGLGIGALAIRRPQDKKEIEQLKNGKGKK